MRHRSKQRWTDQTGEGPVRFLQAGIEFLESLALAFDEAIEAGAFAREMPVDLRLHCGRVRSGKHCFIGEVEGIHRIELPESQVIARPSSAFLEKLVEKKLHHQEGRA